MTTEDIASNQTESRATTRPALGLVMAPPQTLPPSTAPVSVASPYESGIGSSFVGRAGLLFMTGITIIMLVVLIGGLVVFWPVDGAGKGLVPATITVELLGFEFSHISLEQQLFVIVLLAGALGGLLHSIRSLAWYIGNRNLKWSWAPRYVLLPFSSAILSLIFYFVLRAGFLSPGTINDISPFSMAALGSLVGLFAEQALLKLKTVAETLFTAAQKGKDSAPPESNTTAQEGGSKEGGSSSAVVTLENASATVPAGAR